MTVNDGGLGHFMLQKQYHLCFFISKCRNNTYIYCMNLWDDDRNQIHNGPLEPLVHEMQKGPRKWLVYSHRKKRGVEEE